MCLPTQARKPGDALLLTKPLGTGVISTAIKRGKAAPEWIEAATRSMTTLNRSAAEVALRARCAWHDGRHRLWADRTCT